MANRKSPRPGRQAAAPIGKAQARADALSVLVVGLGRFGTATALELHRLDHEVMAIDENPALVDKAAGLLTHVAQADSTDEEALRQLGVKNFDRAVVAIGTDIEASVLTVLALSEAGVPEIWAKAITKKHGKILASVGAHHVVYPESQMGERVAHLVTGAMTDYIEFEDGYAIARTLAPKSLCGKTLAESAPRTRYGVTIVGVKRSGEDFTHAQPDTQVEGGDELVVSGSTPLVERFCGLSSPIPRR